MKLFLLLALLFNCCETSNVVFAAVSGQKIKDRKSSKKIDELANFYEDALRSERVIYNDRSNTEKIIGGSLAFALGTYGYYRDTDRKIAGKIVYSATQSGGILALSSGIVGLTSSSTILAVDSAFRMRGEMTYNDYKSVVVTSKRAAELAEIQKNAISTGLLSILYSYNCFIESKRSEVLRNSFGFLAFNLALFSGVSFYRWIDFDKDLSSKISSQFGLSVAPGSGLVMTYNLQLQ